MRSCSRRCIGDAPATLYDLRREIEERIIEWSPIEAPVRTRKRSGHEPEPAPTLEAVGEDWVGVARAGRLPPVVGVDPVYDQLASILDDESNRLPSLLFVGPRGAGKTALVRRLARGMLDRGRGKDGVRRRLWATTADRIVAGMVYLGMWQQRCLQISQELDGSARRALRRPARRSDGADVRRRVDRRSAGARGDRAAS